MVSEAKLEKKNKKENFRPISCTKCVFLCPRNSEMQAPPTVLTAEFTPFSTNKNAFQRLSPAWVRTDGSAGREKRDLVRRDEVLDAGHASGPGSRVLPPRRRRTSWTDTRSRGHTPALPERPRTDSRTVEAPSGSPCGRTDCESHGPRTHARLRSQQKEGKQGV